MKSGNSGIFEARQKPEDVCPRNCPERSPTCHGTCRQYLVFHEQRKEVYELRETAARIDGYSVDAMVRCMRNPPIVLKQRNKNK